MPQERRFWFTAKQYGFGWQPATREGWLVIAAFLALYVPLILVFMSYVKGNLDHVPEATAALVTAVLLLLAGLLVICYKTGEPARWRWGK